MDIAKELASSPAIRSGTLICTEEQTSGRGRRRQPWHAPVRTSLLLSIILKQHMLPYGVEQLSMRTAVATVTALRTFLPGVAEQLWLKWPNDILAVQNNTDTLKIAGLLVETVFQGNELAHAILGIGINVNQRTDELPPAQQSTTPPSSLYLITDAIQNRTSLLIELCRVLSRVLDITNPQEIFSLWRSMLHTLGRPVFVYCHSHGPNLDWSTHDAWFARAIDVTPDGHLVVRDRGGQIHTVRATDVSIRSGVEPGESA